MRGVYQTAFLDTFAARLSGRAKHTGRIDIGKAFDLVVGTSTGGIVACALAAGVPLRQVQTLYLSHGGEPLPIPDTAISLGSRNIGARLGNGAFQR